MPRVAVTYTYTYYIYIVLHLRIPISPRGLRKAAQLITALCTYLPTTPLLLGLDVLGFKHQHTATAAEAPVGDRAEDKCNLLSESA